MRLLSLKLKRFGHFTDKELDFCPPGENFQLIFGPNEAGKSTARRAVLGLLFGIPERTVDAHLHDMAELRIGAGLRMEDGRELEIIRRKGRKTTLLDPDGTPLDEALLSSLMGGLSRPLYEMLFGLNHDGLVQGGEELLKGGGEIGEALFSAGAGIRGIHTLRKALHDRSDEIFKPRASNPTLNQALRAFADAKKLIRERSVKPRAWEELENKLQEKKKEVEDFEEKNRAALTEMNRLERIGRVLPQVIRYDALVAELEELGEVPDLPDDVTELRSNAQRALHQAETDQKKLNDSRTELEKRGNALEVPEELLARETSIRPLGDQLGAHKKAMLDLPGLRSSAEAAKVEAEDLLRELGRSESLDQVDGLRVHIAARTRVRDLGQQYSGLIVPLEQAKKGLRETEGVREDIQKKIDGLPEPCEPQAVARLKGLLAQIRKLGDLEKELARSERLLVRMEDDAQKHLSALTLWQGSLDDVQRLPLPSEETCDRFRENFAKLEKARETKELERSRIVKELEKISEALAGMEARGEIPTEEALLAIRVERDAAWASIRTSLANLEPLGHAAAEDLAVEYEGLVQSADDYADTLRTEADRVAEHVSLVSRQERYENDVADVEKGLTSIEAQVKDLGEEWQKAWQLAGIAPLPPLEMKAWLDRHHRLADVMDQLRQARSDLEQQSTEIERWRLKTGRCLVEVGERGLSEDEGLGDLLDRAEDGVEAAEKTEQERRQLVREIAREVKTRKKFIAEAESRQAAFEQWRSEWKEAVSPLGLDALASPDQAEAVLSTLERLFEKAAQMRSLEVRIRQIEEDAKGFATEVAALAHECAPDLERLEPAEAAERLIEEFQKGSQALKKREGIEERLDEIAVKLEELQNSRRMAGDTLDELMAKARCDTLEELEATERCWKDQRDKRGKLADLEEHLRSEGISLHELLEQVRAIDPDALPGQLEEALRCSEEISDILKGFREEVGRLQGEQCSMDGRGDAAEAAVEAAQALAAVTENVEEYVIHQMAARLLAWEIDRYREENQGPILERAGEMFSRVTLGEFERLTTDFGAGDELVLVCVRRNGGNVLIQGLSDGTRDQLHLSLRLASIEQHAARNEPVPLIIDDALVNFDDQRAQAALELLGEVSRRTQVLFFTHHSRLCELAREAMGEGMLKEHLLG